jgi:hypothetical protein
MRLITSALVFIMLIVFIEVCAHVLTLINIAKRNYSITKK